MLQPVELSLYRSPLVVQRLEPGRMARNQGVEPVGFDSHRTRRAVPGRATPLRRFTLRVGSGERPHAMGARRRLGVTPHDAGCLADGDNRPDAPLHARVVDGSAVVALVLEPLRRLRGVQSREHEPRGTRQGGLARDDRSGSATMTRIRRQRYRTTTTPRVWGCPHARRGDSSGCWTGWGGPTPSSRFLARSRTWSLQERSRSWR